jgi:hypothetical protein
MRVRRSSKDAVGNDAPKTPNSLGSVETQLKKTKKRRRTKVQDSTTSSESEEDEKEAQQTLIESPCTAECSACDSCH